jgi:hypothetical protein
MGPGCKWKESGEIEMAKCGNDKGFFSLNRAGVGKCFTLKGDKLRFVGERRFWDVRREGCGGLTLLEPEVVEITFRRRMGAKFFDEGLN